MTSFTVVLYADTKYDEYGHEVNAGWDFYEITNPHGVFTHTHAGSVLNNRYKYQYEPNVFNAAQKAVIESGIAQWVNAMNWRMANGLTQAFLMQMIW